MQDVASKEYPYIFQNGKGYRVQMSKGAALPGYYLNELKAEQAMNKALGLRVEHKQKKKDT